MPRRFWSLKTASDENVGMRKPRISEFVYVVLLLDSTRIRKKILKILRDFFRFMVVTSDKV